MRPRKVNQQLLDKMVDLRKRGFSTKDISEKTGLSQRTVKEYLFGLSPILKRKLDIERRELFSLFTERIEKEIYKLGLGMNFKFFNLMVLNLRGSIDSLDDLVIERLRSNEKLREDFISKFVSVGLEPLIEEKRIELLQKRLEFMFKTCPPR